MEFFINIFNTILFQQLFNFLVLLYIYLPGQDFGLAVIILTIIIRFILYPLMAQSIKSQKALSEIQPRLQEVQKKYQNEKEKQAKAIMEIYKKEKINPLGGCLPLLIQLPILIALYQVFWKGLSEGAMANLYSFIPNPGQIDPYFLGMINLAEPSIILAFVAGICQFIQTKMIIPKVPKISAKDSQTAQFSQMIQKQMMYFFPIFTVFILWRLPAAIGIYWLVTTVFSIIQQYLIYSPKKEIIKKEQV